MKLKYTNWEGRNEAVIVCRWYDHLLRKSESVNQIIPGSNKELYSKIVGYHINIQNSMFFFLCTINEQVKFKIKNTVLFKLVPTNIKYVGINLIK